MFEKLSVALFIFCVLSVASSCSHAGSGTAGKMITEIHCSMLGHIGMDVVRAKQAGKSLIEVQALYEDRYEKEIKERGLTTDGLNHQEMHDGTADFIKRVYQDQRFESGIDAYSEHFTRCLYNGSFKY